MKIKVSLNFQGRHEKFSGSNPVGISLFVEWHARGPGRARDEFEMSDVLATRRHERLKFSYSLKFKV